MKKIRHRIQDIASTPKTDGRLPHGGNAPVEELEEGAEGHGLVALGGEEVQRLCRRAVGVRCFFFFGGSVVVECLIEKCGLIMMIMTPPNNKPDQSTKQLKKKPPRRRTCRCARTA